jgi:hypothetical protein
MHAESLPDLVRMAEKEPHMKALITTAYGDVDKLTVGVRLGMKPYKRLAELTEGLRVASFNLFTRRVLPIRRAGQLAGASR